MKQYRSVNNLLWVNYDDEVLVVKHQGFERRLSGEDAALWRWLHQPYHQEEILELYSALLGVTLPEGTRCLEDKFRSWLMDGLVEVRVG